MAPIWRKKPLLHLPGKVFTVEQEEYIIDLKESSNPSLDWETLTNLFNQRFPNSQRSKGGLQVHYSRSLQPGSRRRPASRPFALPNPASNSAQAAEGANTTSAPATSQDYGDTEDTEVPGQSTLNIKGEPLSNSQNIALITTAETTLHLQSSSLEAQASPRRLPNRGDTSDSYLRSATDRTSSFFRDVENIGNTPRARRTTTKSYNISDDERSIESDQDIQNKVSAKKNSASVQVDLSSDSDVLLSAKRSTKQVPKDTTAQVSAPRQRLMLRLRTVPKPITIAPIDPEENSSVSSFSSLDSFTISRRFHSLSRSTTDSPPVDEQQDMKTSPRLCQQNNAEPETEVETPLEWEVCTVGHIEWEIRRLDPHMPQMLKYPSPNRVIEWSSRAKTLRSRARKDSDPPAHLTQGGPLQMPPGAKIGPRRSATSNASSICGMPAPSRIGAAGGTKLRHFSPSLDETSESTNDRDRSISSTDGYQSAAMGPADNEIGNPKKDLTFKRLGVLYGAGEGSLDRRGNPRR